MAGDFAKLLRDTITHADLDAAWRDRLEDAAALEAAGRYAAAIAARLYALEIYLKFRICQRLNLENPPRLLEVHHLDVLIVFSGLSKPLSGLPKSDNLAQNWVKILALSKDHLNNLRYMPTARWTREQSEDFSQWLLDPSMGVLPWLQSQT